MVTFVGAFYVFVERKGNKNTNPYASKGYIFLPKKKRHFDWKKGTKYTWLAIKRIYIVVCFGLAQMQDSTRLKFKVCLLKMRFELLPLYLFY